jgi:hypothetical protein
MNCGRDVVVRLSRMVANTCICVAWFLTTKAGHTRSGLPERSDCAGGLHSFSGTCMLQVCAVFGDCAGGRKKIEKRFFWPAQSWLYRHTGSCMAVCWFTVVRPAGSLLQHSAFYVYWSFILYNIIMSRKNLGRIYRFI